MQNLQLPIAVESSERQVLFKRILEKEELVGVNELAARLCLDAGVVREALNYWVEQGRVEILRPYRASGEREQELDYYRWKKDSDETFRWESELLFKCPYCRNSGDFRNITKERNRFMKHFASALTLAVMLAFGGYAQAQERITIDGSTTVGPIVKAFAEQYMKRNAGVNVTVSESGSGNGAKSLINKTCQIASMSRFMKDKEFSAAVENGVMPVAHVVALDGLPILVHPGNPVGNLSIEQVRRIYAGEIKNWKEVGGPDSAIVVVSRDTNSGTYETFHGLVMEHGGSKDKICASAEYVGSNGAVRQRVQSTLAAIGYAGLGFVDQTVKALSIEGVAPNKATVISGAYPIARPLYLFTDQYPKMGSHLYGLVTMHLTPEGEEIIKTIGFVPVTQYGF